MDPSLGTLLNWGVCEQQRGRVATAWTKLRQFSDTAPDRDPRLNLARRKIAELEPELPKLRVVVSEGEDTATVFLDGVELRSASLGVDLPVDPGEHLVGIKLRTGESSETQVRLGLAEQLEVKLPWPARPAAEAPEPDAAPRRPATSINRPLAEIDVRRVPLSTRTERRWAYGVGTVGAVGLITGGVFGLLAVHERSVVRELCPEHQCRDGRGWDAVHSGARDVAIANVTVAVGTLAIGAAALLWLHSSSSAVGVHAGNNSVSIAFRRELQ